MSHGVFAVLALAAGLFQIGVLPALGPSALAAPLLPIALVAAWATLRDPGEVWPALLPVSVALGVASEQRAGWYLLALLPTAAMLLAWPTGRIAPSRLVRAPLTAAAGAWTYLVLLLAAGGDIERIPAVGVDLALAALGTGVLAATLILVLWPWRSRARGLFA